MKKIFLTLIMTFMALTVMLFGACSCGSGYKDYDDFNRNATPREKEGFYDWWSRNP